MKIEICNKTATVMIVAVVLAGITSVVFVSMRSYNERLKVAFQNGYVESTVAGSAMIVWTKNQ